MSNHFPTAADLADDTLATKPHSKLHGDLGDALSNFIDALGPVDLTGYNAEPTFIAPASTVFDDGTWWQLDYGTGYLVRTVGTQDGTTAIIIEEVNDEDSALVRKATYTLNAASTTGNESMTASFYAQINPDGTGRVGVFDLVSDLTGEVTFRVTDDTAQLQVFGQSGQTAALLDLEASDFTHVLEVTGDKKIGFYNHSPVALQTGVAVNAAGIHAALVNLGLITA